jgi:hypothetical protein
VVTERRDFMRSFPDPYGSDRLGPVRSAGYGAKHCTHCGSPVVFRSQRADRYDPISGAAIVTTYMACERVAGFVGAIRQLLSGDRHTEWRF